MSQVITMIREVVPLDDGLLVRMTGDINFSNSPELCAKLMDAVGQHPQRLIVDLAGVGFMDSSGVALLVEALQHQTGPGRKLILVNLQNKVEAIFKISRLYSVFTVAQTEAEAREM